MAPDYARDSTAPSLRKKRSVCTTQHDTSWAPYKLTLEDGPCRPPETPLRLATSPNNHLFAWLIVDCRTMQGDWCFVERKTQLWDLKKLAAAGIQLKEETFKNQRQRGPGVTIWTVVELIQHVTGKVNDSLPRCFTTKWHVKWSRPLQSCSARLHKLHYGAWI